MSVAFSVLREILRERALRISAAGPRFAHARKAPQVSPAGPIVLHAKVYQRRRSGIRRAGRALATSERGSVIYGSPEVLEGGPSTAVVYYSMI
jgi:hypothetical protein